MRTVSIWLRHSVHGRRNSEQFPGNISHSALEAGHLLLLPSVWKRPVDVADDLCLTMFLGGVVPPVVVPGRFLADDVGELLQLGLSEWPQASYKPLGLEELPVVMQVRFALALALWATF
jgi:hypothetical protein